MGRQNGDSGKMSKMEADFRVRLIHPLTWRMSLAWRPGCHQYGRNEGILKSHLCPLTSLSDYGNTGSQKVEISPGISSWEKGKASAREIVSWKET